MADVIASGRWKSHRVIYCNFSSEVLTRTSSQTCGRWYLPTFLLRDGSLTLMYRASFIVLIWFKSSLPIILNLNLTMAFPSATVAYNICHKMIQWEITAGKNIGNNICQIIINKAITSATINTNM